MAHTAFEDCRVPSNRKYFVALHPWLVC